MSTGTRKDTVSEVPYERPPVEFLPHEVSCDGYPWMCVVHMGDRKYVPGRNPRQQ